jgi:uncharacterized protein (DUF2235 family)
LTRDLIICCDGTGNQFGDRNSNVVKLHDCLPRGDADVIAFYDPGVGTFGLREALFEWQQLIPRVAGLAFGWGYRQMVERAYRFIAEHYRPGDRISFIGFSRGAYIARVVAGMLYGIGLLERHNLHLFDYAFRIYENCMGRNGDSDGNEGFATLKRFGKQFCQPCPVHFIGAFDTVKSIGWFRRWKVLPWTAHNESVAIVRHAVAIDERRCFFRTNLWGAPGKTDLREVWFAGVHSDVGGGYPEQESGLSKLSLQWMFAQAEGAGLRFDPGRKAKLLGGGGRYVRPDAKAPAHRSLHGAWWLAECLLPRQMADRHGHNAGWRWPLLQWKLIGRPRPVAADSLIHDSVLHRSRLLADYQPSNLPAQPNFVPD